MDRFERWNSRAMLTHMTPWGWVINWTSPRVASPFPEEVATYLVACLKFLGQVCALPNETTHLCAMHTCTCPISLKTPPLFTFRYPTVVPILNNYSDSVFLRDRRISHRIGQLAFVLNGYLCEEMCNWASVNDAMQISGCVFTLGYRFRRV